MSDEANLSKPARAVVILPGMTLDDAIATERMRRSSLKAQGHPYHYWRERGDREPPSSEHWCDRCVGFYGVPHDTMTHGKGLCRSLGMHSDCRQCACLECVVYEAWRTARARA